MHMHAVMHLPYNEHTHTPTHFVQCTEVVQLKIMQQHISVTGNAVHGGCRQCSGVSGVEDDWWPCETLPTCTSIFLLSSSPVVEKGYKDPQ